MFDTSWLEKSFYLGDGRGELRTEVSVREQSQKASSLGFLSSFSHLCEGNIGSICKSRGWAGFVHIILLLNKPVNSRF